MPLYEYECDGCGHRFELIRKFSDPPLDACPKCGSGVRKLMSSPAIQFKGSGWYITDYAKKDSTAGGKAAKDTAAGGEAGASGTASTEKASTEKAATTPATPSAPSSTKSE